MRLLFIHINDGYLSKQGL